jgi:SAM-dependent methyltransferase
MQDGEGIPFNYRYFAMLAANEGGRVLDYGCGLGDAIALGRQRGLDIWGADTFAGYFENWSKSLRPEAKDRIRRIEGGSADYPDAHFDVVFSNQVLEHVTDPEQVIADMHRLLKPGGLFIAAFPVVDTWYEGHVGLYFAHRFAAGSASRRSYFNLCHRLGFGLYRRQLATKDWVAMSERTLDEACFYYGRKRMARAIETIFGAEIEDLAADYMRSRLGARVRGLPKSVDPILVSIYHRRAGRIWKARKPASVAVRKSESL